MKKMWARVGISFDVPEEKFQKILKERKNGKAIGVILSTCRQQFDGESYLPADTEDNPDESDLEYLPPKESDPYKARLIPVSYTHLDVYKRQDQRCRVARYSDSCDCAMGRTSRRVSEPGKDVYKRQELHRMKASGGKTNTIIRDVMYMMDQPLRASQSVFGQNKIFCATK